MGFIQFLRCLDRFAAHLCKFRRRRKDSFPAKVLFIISMGAFDAAFRLTPHEPAVRLRENSATGVDSTQGRGHRRRRFGTKPRIFRRIALWPSLC